MEDSESDGNESAADSRPCPSGHASDTSDSSLSVEPQNKDSDLPSDLNVSTSSDDSDISDYELTQPTKADSDSSDESNDAFPARIMFPDFHVTPKKTSLRKPKKTSPVKPKKNGTNSKGHGNKAGPSPKQKQPTITEVNINGEVNVEMNEDHYITSIYFCSRYEVNIYHAKSPNQVLVKQSAYQVGVLGLDLLGLEGEILPGVTYSQEEIVNMYTYQNNIQGKQWKPKSITLHVSPTPKRSVLVFASDRYIPNTKSKNSTQRQKKEVKSHYFYVDLKDTPVEIFQALAHRSPSGFRVDILDMTKGDTLRLQLSVGILHNSIYSNLQGIPPRIASFLPGLKTIKYFYSFEWMKEEENEHSNEDIEENAKGNANKKEDLAWFYNLLKNYHLEIEANVGPLDVAKVSHENLVPVLRNYQKQAVAWMLEREEKGVPAGELDIVQHLSYRLSKEVIVGDSTIGQPEQLKVYLNPLAGYFSWEASPIPPITTGGILADEMGLGKTVEVLGVILLNPRPKDQYEAPTELENTTTSFIEPADSDSESESESDEEYEEVNKKRKKMKARRKTQKKAKRMGVVNVDRLEHPNLRSTKCLSPCQFETKLNMDMDDDENSGCEDKSATNPEGSSNENDVIDPVSIKPKKKNIPESTPTPGNNSTYSRLKVLYDEALTPYAAPKKVEIKKRFKGEFFVPIVTRKKYFECICGEEEDDDLSKDIMTCVICSTSQHAICVRYTNRNSNGNLDEDNYLCPHCMVQQDPIPAPTTLIVAPLTICHQWISEIQRHIKGTQMKILLYKGVSRHGFIPPSILSSFDIIICPYSVLSLELKYAELPHNNSSDGRRLRNAKRFLQIPSTLTNVEFWRVCLDEAQMVEKDMSSVAAMAGKLKSVHRWCVTGTPINKGLDDLRGLMSFLGVHPLGDPTWWNVLVSEPIRRKDYSFIRGLFGRLIWRTGKQDVMDQLGVPPQREVVHSLKFSALESHFYKSHFEVCGRNLFAKLQRLGIRDFSVKLSTLSRPTFNSLVEPLLELRQACVHPQMVRGETLNLTKSTNLTMEELLDQLLKKISVQCADDQRLIVSSLNGMAGIYYIQENFPKAAEKYREVMQLAAKHEARFPTDTLQMLHALENLADIIDMNVPSVGLTLRDGDPRGKAEDLRKKYLEKHATAVKKARDAGAAATAEVQSLLGELEAYNNKKTSWFTNAITFASNLDRGLELVDDVKDQLKGKYTKLKDSRSMANLFENPNGMQQVLVGKIVDMEAMRNSVLLALEDLESMDPKTRVPGAVDCHLRGQNPAKIKNPCTLCKYLEQFTAYENLLFVEERKDKVVRTGRNRQKFMTFPDADSKEFAGLGLDLEMEQQLLLQTTEHINIHEDQRRGHWGDSEVEKALKSILGFARNNRAPALILEEGKCHMKTLEAMKKEFKVLRFLWSQIFDQVSAFDEIAQATTRLRLRSQYERDEATAGPSSSSRSSATVLSKQAKRELESKDTQGEKFRNINVIERHEIEIRMQQMVDEHTAAENMLTTHMGQLVYLETLKKNDYGKTGTLNSDDCPICCNILGQEWSVLQCGHSYCSECVRKMCKDGNQSFLCPICRVSANLRNVFFVDTKGNELQTQTHTPTVRDENKPGTSKAAAAEATAIESNAYIPKEVIGSHSTKVAAIVQTLLQLQDTHPGEKVLIFSTWAEVLPIIGRALEQNYIQFCYLSRTGGGTSKLNSKSSPSKGNCFKERDTVQAMLLQLSSGSKGLNLVEATHVFLVEPILNLASELQAIGRVHRIGQTKTTYIHRFYVRDTVEEQLYNLLKNQEISIDEEAALTVDELRNLFIR